MTICSPIKCSGCFACQNICPKNCISLKEGNLGHLYPEIDETLCINCGACSRVCPQNEPCKANEPTVVYAAYNSDETEHKTSTSGGLAALFSSETIKKGGVVYGCSSKTNEQIKHIRVDNIDSLPLLKGSKYVQSFIGECYREAKADIAEGKTVLFIATPCQIAGLKNFLKSDPDNLITVDILCHGVPSQKVLYEHISNVCSQEVSLISFREEGGSFLHLKDENGATLYRKPSNDDLFYLGFYSNLTLRDSCHCCSFAKKERVSDITIGDFWGLSKDAQINRKNGVSVVLLNTDKGKRLFDEVSSRLVFEERPLEEAIASNHPLRASAVPSRDRERFSALYEKRGFKKAARRLLFKKRLRYKTIRLIQKILHR